MSQLARQLQQVRPQRRLRATTQAKRENATHVAQSWWWWTRPLTRDGGPLEPARRPFPSLATMAAAVGRDGDMSPHGGQEDLGVGDMLVELHSAVYLSQRPGMWPL